MNSVQYEELCRHFLGQKAGVPIEKVTSVRIPNPKRVDLPQYSHQIDLYWETGDEVCLYLNIANAKWRGSAKVDQPDVLLLQQVKQDVAAHKAVLIANTEFTSGAVAAAEDKGIALHIVQPALDPSLLDAADRSAIQRRIQELASSHPVFQHYAVHKAFDLSEATSPHPATPQAAASAYPTAVMPEVANRAVVGYSNKGGPGSGAVTKGAGGGFRTK